MKTLTIRLPDALAERLEREARDRGVTKSDVVRERLTDEAPRHLLDRTVEEILKSSWSAQASAPRAKAPSAHKRRLIDAIRAKKLPRR